MNWLRQIISKTHVHRWEGSCWNGWCHDVEQTCRCGLRRHAATFGHHVRDEWIAGPHPKAEELRRAEVVEQNHE